MKKRYSKSEKKSTPSRRKLSSAVKALEVIASQQRHELRCQAEDLDGARSDRRQWRSRAEAMQQENEKLRKQMDAMLPVNDFVTVGSWQPNREMMMRNLHVNNGVIRVGVDVSWRAFERRDMGRMANEAFIEATVDSICRRAKEELAKQFFLIG